jgi:hypothetical protein
MLDYLVIPTIKPPNTKTLFVKKAVSKLTEGKSSCYATNSLEKKKSVKKIKEPPIIYK